MMTREGSRMGFGEHQCLGTVRRRVLETGGELHVSLHVPMTKSGPKLTGFKQQLGHVCVVMSGTRLLPGI